MWRDRRSTERRSTNNTAITPTDGTEDEERTANRQVNNRDQHSALTTELSFLSDWGQTTGTVVNPKERLGM